MKKMFCFMALVFLVGQGSPLMSQWTRLASGFTSNYPFWFAVKDSNIFVSTLGQVIFLSTNNGTTWNQVNSGLTNTTVYALFISGTNVFAGTQGGIFLTTNNGTNWAIVDSGLTQPYGIVINSLTQKGSNIFAGTQDGVFLSANNGISWTQFNNGIAGNPPAINDVLVNESTFFAASQNYGIYVSTNNGGTWTPSDSGLTNGQLESLLLNGTSIFAATWGPGQVFRSADNGAVWTAVALPYAGNYVFNFAVIDTNIFVSTENGVYLSTNNGSSWTSVGGWAVGVYGIAISGQFLYAGTSSLGLWRRPLSDMIPTSVNQSRNGLPTQFKLEQNYPNPFNPSTRIKYILPKSAYVSLKIYDVLGREIVTLVNGKVEPGYHTVNWNALSIPSGVYFYRLTAGDFVQTKRMVLLK